MQYGYEALTRWVNRSRRLSRVGWDGGVSLVGSGDLVLGSLDLGVDAEVSS